MSYTVFARKYRPQKFDDVIGQEHITRTLKNAIEQDRLAHAYIFVGPRGTGKTSTARILAKALNCVKAPTVEPCGECDPCREIAAGTSLDVLEFDAASNTQVDKIREIIIENVKYAPTRGRYKLYIVDEVHMLSTSSFNALLKTLEEPPAHVKFIFATTDVQKVPTTILSRCQRFDLKRIPAALIAKHLLDIAVKENMSLTHAAADTLARGAEGGMRDAESMLDQLVAFCGNEIEEEDVLKIFGFTSKQAVSQLCDHLIGADIPTALTVVHEQAEAGKDLSRLMADLITHLRNLLVAKADPESVKQELGEEATVALSAQAETLELPKLLDLIDQFAQAEARMKWAPNKKMHFEIAVIRAVQSLNQTGLSEVIEALAALKNGEAPATQPRTQIQPRKPIAAQKLAVPSEPSKQPATKPDPGTPPTHRAEAVAAAPATAVQEQPEPSPFETTVENKPPQNFSSDPAIADDALWPTLVAEVRRLRPLIATWVEAGTLLQVENDAATIGFPPEQSLAAEYCQQPNNRKFLEELAERLAGRSLRLNFVKRNDLQARPAEIAELPASSQLRNPVEEFRNDPLIRKALEMFKGQIA